MGRFDPMCNARINRLLRSGGVGQASVKTLTYDGNGTPHTGMGNFVYVGEPIDPATITQITAMNSGSEVVFQPEDLIMERDGDTRIDIYAMGVQGVIILLDGNAENAPAGTYVYSYEGTYISNITTRTVKPIDPKFLPNGGMGYVENVVLTFDGDLSDKEFLPIENGVAIKVSTAYIPYDSIKVIEISVGATKWNLPKDELNLIGFEGCGYAVGWRDNIPCLISMHTVEEESGISPGTYLCAGEEHGITRVEAEILHTIDPMFLPGAEVVVLEDYGISLQTLFAAGGGRQYIDASPLFAKIERGKRYILRGAYDQYFIEAEPTFIQYSADGRVVAVAVTIKATMNDTIMVTADYEIYSTQIVCVVSSTNIPS